MELNPPLAGSAEAARGPAGLATGGLVSAILVGLVGALVIFVTPGFLSIVAQQTGFNDEQLGYRQAARSRQDKLPSWSACRFGLSGALLGRPTSQHQSQARQ